MRSKSLLMLRLLGLAGVAYGSMQGVPLSFSVSWDQSAAVPSTSCAQKEQFKRAGREIANVLSSSSFTMNPTYKTMITLKQDLIKCTSPASRVNVTKAPEGFDVAATLFLCANEGLTTDQAINRIMQDLIVPALNMENQRNVQVLDSNLSFAVYTPTVLQRLNMSYSACTPPVVAAYGQAFLRGGKSYIGSFASPGQTQYTNSLNDIMAAYLQDIGAYVVDWSVFCGVNAVPSAQCKSLIPFAMLPAPLNLTMDYTSGNYPAKTLSNVQTAFNGAISSLATYINAIRGTKPNLQQFMFNNTAVCLQYHMDENGGDNNGNNETQIVMVNDTVVLIGSSGNGQSVMGTWLNGTTWYSVNFVNGTFLLGVPTDPPPFAGLPPNSPPEMVFVNDTVVLIGSSMNGQTMMGTWVNGTTWFSVMFFNGSYFLGGPSDPPAFAGMPPAWMNMSTSTTPAPSTTDMSSSTIDGSTSVSDMSTSSTQAPSTTQSDMMTEETVMSSSSTQAPSTTQSDMMTEETVMSSSSSQAPSTTQSEETVMSSTTEAPSSEDVTTLGEVPSEETTGMMRRLMERLLAVVTTAAPKTTTKTTARATTTTKTTARPTTTTKTTARATTTTKTTARATTTTTKTTARATTTTTKTTARPVTTTTTKTTARPVTTTAPVTTKPTTTSLRSTTTSAPTTSTTSTPSGPSPWVNYLCSSITPASMTAGQAMHILMPALIPPMTELNGTAIVEGSYNGSYLVQDDFVVKAAKNFFGCQNVTGVLSDGNYWLSALKVGDSLSQNASTTALLSPISVAIFRYYPEASIVNTGSPVKAGVQGCNSLPAIMTK